MKVSLTAALNTLERENAFVITPSLVHFRERVGGFVAEIFYRDDSNYSINVVETPKGFDRLPVEQRGPALERVEQILLKDMKGNLVCEAINGARSAARKAA